MKFNYTNEPTVGEPHSNPGEEINLNEILKILWKGKWLILIISILSTLYGYYYFYPGKYVHVAEAVLGIPKSDIGRFFPNHEASVQRSIVYRIIGKFEPSNLEAIYTSQKFLTELAQRVGIKAGGESNIQKELKKRISVAYIGQDYTRWILYKFNLPFTFTRLRVKIIWTSQEKAKKIAELWVDLFFESVRARVNHGLLDLSEKYRKAIQKYEKDLSEAKAQYLKMGNEVVLEEELRLKGKEISRLRMELNDLQNDHSVNDLKIRILEKELSRHKPRLDPENSNENSGLFSGKELVLNPVYWEIAQSISKIRVKESLFEEQNRNLRAREAKLIKEIKEIRQKVFWLRPLLDELKAKTELARENSILEKDKLVRTLEVAKMDWSLGNRLDLQVVDTHSGVKVVGRSILLGFLAFWVTGAGLVFLNYLGRIKKNLQSSQ
ncbi:MAG: Wzz/FepE/Etk N-terminal domain-containing protein [Nitrospinales bacterium]